MMTMIMLTQHTAGITTNINIADHIGSIASDDALAIKKRKEERREKGEERGKRKSEGKKVGSNERGGEEEGEAEKHAQFID